MVEMLWMPDDCIRVSTDISDKIIENRKLFISKASFYSHAGYANAQIKKAKGANKRVHNPQPEERPVKEDFCWVMGFNDDGFHGTPEYEQFPCRPIPLKQSGIDLSSYHASSLEHSHNIFRIYDYGDSAKGVFRGDDMLVCESIPYSDEFTNFSGLLIYNQEAYEQAVRKWKEYWDWMKNRNEARWVDQEKGKLNYQL
jgi:hypothetical protein